MMDKNAVVVRKLDFVIYKGTDQPADLHSLITGPLLFAGQYNSLTSHTQNLKSSLACWIVMLYSCSLTTYHICTDI